MNIDMTAFWKGKEVRRSTGNIKTRFDGFRLDLLNIKIDIHSQKDCDDLIELLKVHRYCFLEEKQPTQDGVSW